MKKLFKLVVPTSLATVRILPTFALHNENNSMMEVITMESKAYKALVAKINRIEKFILENKKVKPDPENLWLDKETVCAYLKVSKRTLQRFRSNGTIAYSFIGKKTYYSVSAIKQLLKNKNIHRDKSSLDELADKGQIQVTLEG